MRRADLNLRWALGHESFESYPSWIAKRESSIAPEPRSDWSTAPEIVIVVDAGTGSDNDLQATFRSLEAQTYTRWRSSFALVTPRLRSLYFRANEPRCAAVMPVDVDGRAFWCCLRAGDELVPQALSCFVEYFARNPDCAIAYADDVAVSETGEESANLKPNWSPTLQELCPYVGLSALWRSSATADAIATGPGAPHDIVENMIAACAA